MIDYMTLHRQRILNNYLRNIESHTVLSISQHNVCAIKGKTVCITARYEKECALDHHHSQCR